jgi:hypothetical protein
MDRLDHPTVSSPFRAGIFLILALLLALLPIAPVAAQGDALVTVGSPQDTFPQNKQNEPGLAVDPTDPSVLAAGANEEIDLQPCPSDEPASPPRCPFTEGVGISGIYFSFDGGDSWTQPTYTGWTARDCTPDDCEPHEGDIGTLPQYYENRLVSNGDPALAFGPQPDADGHFDWENGSRLYYANIATNFPGNAKRDETFKGEGAIAVSRTDDVEAAAAGDQDAWRDPVIVTRQSSALFSDKEALWADNAASSPFFGNVYVCNVAFRSKGQGGAPEPVMVARSTDGGDSWQQRQISQAANSVGAGRSGGRQGCTIRTDSKGVVYIFWNGSLKRQDVQYLSRSFDGGRSFEKARPVANVAECGELDPVQGRFTFDGVAGSRTNSFPSADIANGAPTGVGAPDTIVLAWCDARNGLNHEEALVQRSTNGGKSWSQPTNGAEPTDRPDFPAVAISPDGNDVYLVYDGFLDKWQTTTANPRRFEGVVRHADSTLAGWATLHRGATGDARGSSANGLTAGFLGDYNYAVATNDYGAAVWNDARDAADCPAIDDFRQSLVDGDPQTIPDLLVDCPPTFGNTDIYGGGYADPTLDAAAQRASGADQAGQRGDAKAKPGGKKGGQKHGKGGKKGRR